MERFIMQDLIAWKNRKDRKPLILLGARQVGKTYIFMRDFWGYTYTFMRDFLLFDCLIREKLYYVILKSFY